MAVGENIKKLGFGLMRLPMKDGAIDIELIKEMVDEFEGHGFSYYDTSPVYGGGLSEATFKTAVSDRYPRDKFHIATKLPMWTINSPEEVEPKFEASLKALGVDYVDFYLIHGLSTVVSDRFPNSYLDKADRFGVWDFLKKIKADGRAKHIGFSYHSSAEDLDAILTAHPEVEFVQLQINYVDWEDSVIQSRACYEVARRHGVGVTVMEPCKGGTLVEVRSDVRAIMESANPNASLASWAIRFAASNDGIITVLSGMGNMEQMCDNVSYMDNFKPLDDGEREVLAKVVDKLADVDTIRCTGCRYCTDGCPMSIRIPDIFSMYNNEVIYEGKGDGRRRFANHIKTNTDPAECIECGQCEAACPQHLPIIESLKLAGGKLRV